MPENIYPINVGQVDISAPNGGGRGSIGGAGGSLNSLMRFQQRMMDIEAAKQLQAQKNADALFGNISSQMKIGAEGEQNMLGLTPMNNGQAKLFANASKLVQDNIGSFANSDRNPNSYAQFTSGISKIINDPKIRAAAITNKVVTDSIKDIQTNKLNVHPLVLDEINRFTSDESEDGSGYDISRIKNYKDYIVPPINDELDFKHFKDQGKEIKVIEDPLSGQALLVTSQNNKNYITKYYQEKYGKNFALDYDRGVLNGEINPNETGQQEFINAKIAEKANAFSTNEDISKTVLGKTEGRLEREGKINTKQAQDEERAKNVERLDLAKAKDKISDENLIDREKSTMIVQDNKLKNSKDIVGLLNEGQLRTVIESAKTKGKNIELSKVKDANTKIAEDKTESEEETVERILEKAGEIVIPVSKERNIKIFDKLKSELIKATKENDIVYQVTGNKDKHGLKTEEFFAKSGLGNALESAGVKKGYDKFNQTVLEEINGTTLRGGNKYATGTIITSNKGRASSLPTYYEKYKKEITEEERKKLKDKGYKLHKDEKYYRVPVEIEISNPKISSFNTKTQSRTRSIAGENNNPTNIREKGSKKFKIYSSIEDGFKDAITEIEKKMNGTPAIEASKKARNRSGETTTLADLIETWSPRESTVIGGQRGDNSDEVVDAYIKDVANNLNIKANTPLSEIDSYDLALALARHEDPKVYEELLAVLENNSEDKQEVAKKPVKSEGLNAAKKGEEGVKKPFRMSDIK